jgi:hypothetical protein
MATFEQGQKWGKTRASGKRRFLLVNGLLIPALTFVLLAILSVIIWPGNIFTPVPSRNETPKIIILLPGLLACLAASYYSMTKVWDSSEKAYKDALEAERKPEENIPPPA